MRHLLGVMVATGAAVLGALILGEYDLNGATAFVAAVLFGLAVAEALVSVGRVSGTGYAVLAALLVGAGFAWAAWIFAGRDWDFVEGIRWAALPVGAVAAAFWVRSSGRRATDSPPPPSP
jgi:hypothetical protein